MIKTAVLILCVLISSGLFADEPDIFSLHFNWNHPDQVIVTDKEMVFTGRRTSHFKNESLYFTGRLDNGWLFTAGFFNCTWGLFNGYGAYALIVDQEGNSHWTAFPVKRKYLEFGSDHLLIQSTNILDNILIERSGMHYHLNLESEELSLELYFNNILPPWMPGSGVTYPTKDKSISAGITVPSPWANVSGRIKTAEQTIDVTGEGYSDLSLFVYPPNRLNSPVFCFRGFSRPETTDTDHWFLSVVEYTSHHEYGSQKLPILLLAHGNKWIMTSRSFTVTPLDFIEVEDTPYSYPSRCLVRLEDQGYKLNGEYRILRLYHITDIFDNFPRAISALASLFVKRPINYRTECIFQGTLQLPDGTEKKLCLYGPSEYLVIK